jgi:uncharacterized protein involved in exopolysaccharide biosynthesis
VDIELPDRLGDNEVTLGEQLATVWSRKWFVLSGTAIAAAIAIAAAFLVTPQYQASVLLMPVSPSSARGGLGGLSSLGSGVGGLAALAGLSLGGSEEKAESVAVLQSEALTDRYIERNNLLPILYKKRWNPLTKTWKSTDPDDVPTLWKANRYFKGHIRSVGTNTKTGLVTLTITWTNAQQAATWANGLVKMTNDYLRNKAIDEAQHNIDYLTAEAAKTNIADVKEGIYSILLDQIKKAMLARGTEEYAFRVVDPAVAPEKPYSPKKVVWMLVGGCLGLLVSSGVVLIQADRRR